MDEPIERTQLVGATASGCLGFDPFAPQDEDLRLVDPAVAGRGPDASALCRLRPLPGSPVVRELAARPDHVAVHLPGDERRELPADRRERRLVDHGETVRDVAPLHEGHAPEHHAGGLHVSISQPLADLGGPACELDGFVQVDPIAAPAATVGRRDSRARAPPAPTRGVASPG